MVTETTPAAVERIVDEFLAAWSAHDSERLLRLFTDDVEYEDVPAGAVNHGKAELRAFAEGWFAASPDIRFELTSKVVTGSHAAAEWVGYGTQRGDLPGMPASGKQFRVRGASVMELAGGKVKRCTDYWDFATVMRQLGFLPEVKS
ncbi:MAG TPA: ester cyclase [Dehalococcoidia bacterium]|nr:ester cyclase [Dehalococcoidia bacterium]